jgi:hypothetical protein
MEVPTLQQLCLDKIRQNLKYLSGIKSIPAVFQQEILKMFIYEIKKLRRHDLKWAYFVALSRPVKKFIIHSIPCKTLATNILNIRTKKRVLRLLAGTANFETVVRECLSESQSRIEQKQKQNKIKQTKKERSEKQFKIKKNRYEKKRMKHLKNCRIENTLIANGNKRYHKVNVNRKQQWKTVNSI